MEKTKQATKYSLSFYISRKMCMWSHNCADGMQTQKGRRKKNWKKEKSSLFFSTKIKPE